MRPVSDEFLAAVRSSHTARFEARVVISYQTGTDPDGIEIPILDGDIVHDGAADIRATLDLTTLGDFPYQAGDLLAPYGNEIFVRRGIEMADRSVEWVGQGYFRIDTVAQGDVPVGSIDVSASDRMAGIIDARMLRPRQYRPDNTVSDVFFDLIQDVYSSAVPQFPDWPDAHSTQIGRKMVVEEERFEFLRDLAQSYARDFYVDHTGTFVVKARPDASTVLFDVDGGEGGVLVEASREITREGVYNAVAATGEGADDLPPVLGIAVDNSPQSATYWSGRFGAVPRFYSSPFIRTVQQARNTARKMLQEQLGLPYSLDFTTVPNPALEPYDPVEVRLPDQTYVHQLERLTIPLTADQPLTAQTKDVTLVQRIETASA